VEITAKTENQTNLLYCGRKYEQTNFYWRYRPTVL